MEGARRTRIFFHVFFCFSYQTATLFPLLPFCIHGVVSLLGSTPPASWQKAALTPVPSCPARTVGRYRERGRHATPSSYMAKHTHAGASLPGNTNAQTPTHTHTHRAVTFLF